MVVAQATVDQTKAVVDQMQAALGEAQAVLKQMQAQLTSAEYTRNSFVAEKAEAVHELAIVKTSGQAAIDSAKDTVKQAKATLTYARSNSAQTPAYVQNLKALEAVVVSTQGTLDSARAQLAQTVLTAPLDGYVTKRYMDPGAMATPGTPILGLQFFHQVWVTVTVPPEVSAQVHLGDPVKVTFDSLPGQTFTASVIQNNPGGDPTSRLFTVRAVMSNPQGQFKPQMFAHVFLETQRTIGALSVPREAVQQDATGSYLVVVDKTNTAHRVRVVTGTSDASDIAILQGLQPGDTVVTISPSPVKDGQKVTISQAPPPAPGTAAGAAAAPGSTTTPGAAAPSGSTTAPGGASAAGGGATQAVAGQH
jgi:membrane fusion protein (multidrug efflux system)